MPRSCVFFAFLTLDDCKFLGRVLRVPISIHFRIHVDPTVHSLTFKCSYEITSLLHDCCSCSPICTSSQRTIDQATSRLLFRKSFGSRVLQRVSL
ncbi:hypothetical protein BGY98DRAFT_960483 [Russula aff. rugulosa BPL654]|nr:hypothetical protein BGY98DRAFT_960483 [Russula aff. rugulosa BPL654]